MGCFDSLYINCPKCGKKMEWQSKSGPCALFSYKKSNLPMDVAIDLDNQILNCEFCNSNWQFKLFGSKRVKFKIIKTKKRQDYRGNYNPKLPKNIKEAKHLAKIIGIKYTGGKS